MLACNQALEILEVPYLLLLELVDLVLLDAMLLLLSIVVGLIIDVLQILPIVHDVLVLSWFSYQFLCQKFPFLLPLVEFVYQL